MGFLRVSLFGLFVVLVAGPVLADGGDIVYPVKNIGDVTFRHSSHGGEGRFDCEQCHDGIFPMQKNKQGAKTMDQMRNKKACGVCHNGKNAFDVRENCYLCHKRN